MTSFCKTKVPQEMWDELLPIKDDDEAVKNWGIVYMTNLCRCVHIKTGVWDSVPVTCLLSFFLPRSASLATPRARLNRRLVALGRPTDRLPATHTRTHSVNCSSRA